MIESTRKVRFDRLISGCVETDATMCACECVWLHSVNVSEISLIVCVCVCVCEDTVFGIYAHTTLHRNPGCDADIC